MGNLYHKYIVKSHAFFVVLIVIFVLLFLYISYTIKLSVVETFDGTSGDDRLIINQIVDYPVDKIYVYQDRSEKVCSYIISKTECVDDSFTVLYIKNNGEKNQFDGVVKIDVEKEKVDLLSILLGFKKRYVEKDLK